MKTIYAPTHLQHAPKEEFEGGRMNPAVEIPIRVERVRAEIEARKLGTFAAATEFGNEPLLRVHDPVFVNFMREAHSQWIQQYGADAPDAIPSAWPARGLRDRREGDIESRLGSYAFDTATPITKGTWDAARSGANIALTGAQELLRGGASAFALARPPGHHASADVFGGYCYLNNIAIAAQFLRDAGLKPAILDVDYHHGNGTQSIFYRRDDVLFVSIHADPSFAYPHFLGFADERGEGRGEGATLNLPLPALTKWPAYSLALDSASARIREFGADVLLVSLGLDTFEGDPISRFKLTSDDYLRLGERLKSLKLPTLFVFEGGYNVDMLGVITANVLQGFESA